MEVKVLGTGCPTCKKVYKDVEEVIKELCIDASLEKIEDIPKIMEYGIMSVPALVIDNKVIFSGKAPNRDELKKYFI